MDATPTDPPRNGSAAFGGPAIIGLAGWSGSGKTSLIVGVIPELRRHGCRVATVKHAHHEFDIDKPGKDSHRHRTAGATEVVVSSSQRWAIMHENHGAPEPTLEEIVARLSPTDIVLVEGYKNHRHPKIEVHRPSMGQPLLCRGNPTIVAVASDEAPAGGPVPVPVLDLNDPAAVAAFILERCGYAERVEGTV